MRGMEKENIREIVAEICEADIHEVKDHSDFVDDLGIDSMMMLEIIALIEKRLGITIPEQKLQDVSSMTLSDFIDIIGTIQLQ